MYVNFLPNRNQKHFKRIASVAEFSWKYFKKKALKKLYTQQLLLSTLAFFFYFSWWEAAMTIFFIKQNSDWTAHFSWAQIK